MQELNDWRRKSSAVWSDPGQRVPITRSIYIHTLPNSEIYQRYQWSKHCSAIPPTLNHLIIKLQALIIPSKINSVSLEPCQGTPKSPFYHPRPPLFNSSATRGIDSPPPPPPPTTTLASFRCSRANRRKRRPRHDSAWREEAASVALRGVGPGRARVIGVISCSDERRGAAEPGPCSWAAAAIAAAAATTTGV